MRVRFQADADLDGRVVRGLRRAAPEIDIGTAAEAGLEGVKDPDVLRIAADAGRILVSQDRRTMPGHFARFTATEPSPGVILLREAISIATAIEELLLIWSASEAKEWNGRESYGFLFEPACPEYRTTACVTGISGSGIAARLGPATN